LNTSSPTGRNSSLADGGAGAVLSAEVIRTAGGAISKARSMFSGLFASPLSAVRTARSM
jgi:hypothetical protein